MLANALDGVDHQSLEVSDPLLCPAPPPYPLRLLSLDIETYGAIRGMPEQKHFHPRKSEAYDGVAPSRMIQTVGLSWRDPDGVLHSGIFPRSSEFRNLWDWLRKLRADDGELLGQNLTFDVGYLRYCYPFCRRWLDHPLRLRELSVQNYLHNEARPERSLKSLAPLLSVTKYEGGMMGRYSSDRDPRLWRYNCQDTGATLLCDEELSDAIRSYYGDPTEKLSPSCQQWYSDLLWLIVWMSEAGVCMSHSGLSELMERYNRRRDRIVGLADRWWQMPLKGKGSEKAKRAVVNEALDELGDDAPEDMKLTDKKREVSFCDENRNALLDKLDRKSDAALKLRAMQAYSSTSKILDSYLMPLLVGRGPRNEDPSTRLLSGVVYPRWFPVPSQFDDGGEGGTIQSRIVCKSPAVQTFPRPIKKRITYRFRGGRLIWFDYSQIELRVAALLSNDAAMMAEYAGKPDLHTKTARLIFGDSFVDEYIKNFGLPAFKESQYRQAGKTLNFLVLFRGGARQFHITLMRDVGLDYPIPKCQEAINAFRRRHSGLIVWQDGLVSEAKSKGCLELPITGQSRLFLGGSRAVDSQINEVCNFPVQATAANIMESAQFELWRRFRSRGLKSIVPLNIYDAAAIEVAPYETDSVLSIMEDVLPNPPYFQELCGRLGRTIPLTYDFSLGKSVTADIMQV